MKITLIGFSGEQPRLLPTLLPDSGAREAWDVRLDDGGLTPTRRPIVVAAVTVGHQTIYRHQGNWITRSGNVSFVPGPVADDRLYFTGDGAPKVLISGDIYALAVPRPAAALTATPSGSGTGNIATRLYVYTHVTAFGEESEPSPISNEINWQSGQSVTLSGFSAVPSGRGIDKQRIYRSQTGQTGTYLYLIAERTASAANYVDTIPVDAFQESLPSADWNAPPAGLSGLISMPNGIMAAFVGRDVYFCEPWRPHAWPEKYVLTTDSPIVGLAAIGNTLLIMTAGMPYVATGLHPADMAMRKIDMDLPCINARAVVNLGFAVCYPSHDGLVSVSPSGGASIVTASLFDRERWQALSPQTAVAARRAGRYVMFYDTMDGDVRRLGAFEIDLSGQSFLVRHSVAASAAWYEVATGTLYYCRPGATEIAEFQPTSGAPHTLLWSSKEFLHPAPHNYGVLLVDSASSLSAAEQAVLTALRNAVLAQLAAESADDDLGAPLNATPLNDLPIGGDEYTIPLAATIGPEFEAIIIADGNIVHTTRDLDRPVRLPAGFTARTWEVSIRSNVSIKQATLATTMADLRG